MRLESEPPSSCPCGTGRDFAACCGPALDGSQPPATPEALMRSRYAAFVLADAAYLEATHAAVPTPGTRAPLAAWARIVLWLGLTIHEAPPAEGDEGEVAFTARYLEDRVLVALSERSRFRRVDGRWLYVDGQVRTVQTKLGKKDPCPCGSGKSFAQCHR
jgi:SEC-C motif-containing protein